MADSDDRRIAARQPARTPMTANRIDQLKARIDAGAYASEAVLQATARAILDRGDL